jgi:outer membrane protein OmpA-like peptidoglycan-associated protein/tetratricopeptide (TPR) repeat protein
MLAACCMLMPAVSRAQEYSSGNPAAIRAFEQAVHYYDERANDKALEALNTAIGKDPSFVEAYTLRGNVYDDMRKFDLSAESYKKAIELKPDFFINTYFSLGNAEFRTGRYEESKAHLQTYTASVKANKILVEKAGFLIRCCDFAMEAIKHPVPFKPVNLGDSINTADDEVLPTITADGKFLLFERQFQATDMYGKKSRGEDFYISEYKKNYWKKAAPLTELNTSGNEGASCFSPDGQYLFFTGCESNFGYPEGREKGLGSCDIYISKKSGAKFQTPRDLGIPINTEGYETQPSFSSDGRTLYFIRKVKNAAGVKQQDIFVSFIDDNSTWSEPVALPSNINTDRDEFSVFIHPDNQTLYFSSSGHPGFGGLDIFMSRRKDDGSWGDPVNLGYPINTSSDESSLLVSPDGSVAYFASNREDSRGGLDLYQFDLYDGAKPNRITYLKGTVFDADTKKPLAASFELIDLQTAKTMVRSVSNDVTGEFLVCLPSGKSYALNVSKDGYLFYSDNFQLKDTASVKAPFAKDIPLKPIKAGQSIVLKNVFYEVDKYELKDESRAELGKIIAFMKKNPTVKVEIGGHTDNTGSKEHNQMLSENRAKTVYDHLLASGADASHLVYKGYADTKPVTSNNTEAGRAQNRRTEFMIVSVN